MAQAEHPALVALAQKFEKEPMKKGKPDWNSNSRHLLVHLFFNIFGEKAKMSRQDPTKLPSLDAKAMEKLKTPEGRSLGKKITHLRSLTRSLDSFLNAMKFIFPASAFGVEDSHEHALISYRTMGADCVERVFTKSEESIPLNLDKSARNAFVTSGAFVPLEAFKGNLQSLQCLSKNDWRVIFSMTPNLYATIDLSVADQPDETLLNYFMSEVLPDARALSSWMDNVSELWVMVPAEAWVSFDWSQAEVYKLALFSQDHVLYHALSSQDFHGFVAKSVFPDVPENCPIDLIKTAYPDLRELAKTLTFAFIYSSFDIKVAAAIVMSERPDMDEAVVVAALEKYIATFRIAFDWVQTALATWAQGDQTVTYAFGGRKWLECPPYLKPESYGSHQSGRTAINTYGQNSVGLLLKHTMAHLAKQEAFPQHTTEYIPVFDALYFKCSTTHLAEVMKELHHAVTPVLSLHPENHWYKEGAFSIQMKAEFKVSCKSWGEVQTVKCPESDLAPLSYTF